MQNIKMYVFYLCLLLNVIQVQALAFLLLFHIQLYILFNASVLLVANDC